MNRTYEYEDQIQVKVIEDPLWDFICNINYVLIEFLDDCKFTSKDDCPINLLKGESCILGFYGDFYLEREDVLILNGFELRIYEKNKVDKSKEISCAKIYNKTKGFMRIPAAAKEKKTNESNIEFKGKIIGKPHYGAYSKNVYFPIKLETKIIANFKKTQRYFNPGDILLIRSLYYCYVKKGDEIIIKQWTISELSSKKIDKKLYILNVKDFWDVTLKYPIMPC